MSTTETTPLLNDSIPSSPKSDVPTPSPTALTLTYEQSLIEVPWQTDSVYIRTGWRRLQKNVGGAMWTAVGFWHNETINIHSHLLGSLFYLSLIPYHLITSPHLPEIVIVSIFLLSAMTCLGLSSYFHIVSCCQKDIWHNAHTGDYIGIIILIVGSFYACLFYGFQDEPIWRGVYISAITILGIAAAQTVISPTHRSSTAIWARTLTFISLGLSGAIPVIHVISTKGWDVAARKMGADWMIASGASYIFGAVLYAARIPERLSPGTFDILFSSHQIFHCFVLLGSWCTYQGIRKMSQYVL